MRITTCPKCKGKGYIIEIDWLYSVFTFGIGLLENLSTHYECDSCNGKGYIEVKND